MLYETSYLITSIIPTMIYSLLHFLLTKKKFPLVENVNVKKERLPLEMVQSARSHWRLLPPIIQDKTNK